MLIRELLIFCFTGQSSISLHLPVANEASSAESNVVKLEGLEESPVIEDMAMKKSSTIGDYHFRDLRYQCTPKLTILPNFSY